ncbi:MAG: DNA mismatch repair endonuclease MutL, partial [Elusimicrobiota bacterium]
MKIKILPNNIVEKIAAGEVVSRPSSVVKELVENSIDAEAHNIQISIRKGGINFIQVSDDGFGMTEQDLKLAAKSHATSKIDSFEDLQRIHTMGFRGEALPSICAVSKVTIISKTEEDKYAHVYKVFGNRGVEQDISARNTGTTVKVEELFFNVPARKKFLKTENTEKRHIISTTEMLGLAREDIRFRLEIDGKIKFDLPPATLKQRFLNITGKNISENLIDTDFRNPFVELKGYITKPGTSYSNKKRIFFFVNDRPVKSPVLLHAFIQGTKEYFSPNRYPACILKIKIDPELIDVNIHPTKKEVKFVNQKGIHEIVSKVIRRELSRTSGIIDKTISTDNRYEREKVGQEMKTGSLYGQRNLNRLRQSKKDYLKDIDLSEITKFTFSGPKKDEIIRDK